MVKARTHNPTLRRLDLGERFTFQELAGRVEVLTGRQLVLWPWQMPPGISGAWLRSPATDYIFYPADTSPGHQRHCQLHELGHILAGHEPVSDDAGLIATALDQTCPSGEVVRALYRHRYTTVEEKEAETLATLLMTRLAVAPDVVFDDEDLDHHVQACLQQLGL